MFRSQIGFKVSDGTGEMSGNQEEAGREYSGADQFGI